jgi:hypothetical protein
MSEKPARTLRKPWHSAEKDNGEEQLKRNGKAPAPARFDGAKEIGHPIADGEAGDVHTKKTSESEKDENRLAHIMPRTTNFPRQDALDVSLCHTGEVEVFSLTTLVGKAGGDVKIASNTPVSNPCYRMSAIF